MGPSKFWDGPQHPTMSFYNLIDADLAIHSQFGYIRPYLKEGIKWKAKIPKSYPFMSPQTLIFVVNNVWKWVVLLHLILIWCDILVFFVLICRICNCFVLKFHLIIRIEGKCDILLICIDL